MLIIIWPVSDICAADVGETSLVGSIDEVVVLGKTADLFKSVHKYTIIIVVLHSVKHVQHKYITNDIILVVHEALKTHNSKS